MPLTIPMGKIQSFLWWCAGIDKKIISKTPTETSKYFGIGATVLFTGIFAALAAGYALHTVFDSIFIAIGFGLLWGLMIFNLDRYIVSSMRKYDNRWRELRMALPRIILAVIISIVIARPLELKIFEKEIESELVMMKQEDITQKEAIIKSRLQSENETLKSEIAALENEIEAKEQKRDELLQIAREEADGTGGSMRRNAGPIYKLKKADADKADMELSELRERNSALINEKLDRIKANDSLTQETLASVEYVALDGLASRLEGMDRLTAKSNAIYVAHIFILLLFIAVETAPIIVKLLAPKGPYDFHLHEEEYFHEANHYAHKARINSDAKKAAENLSGEEADYVREKLNVSLNKS